MSGTMSYYYKQYLKEKAEQEGIEKAYVDLKQKPIDLIQRYKSRVMDNWKPPIMLKIVYFPYKPVPLRFVAVEKILEEYRTKNITENL